MWAGLVRVASGGPAGRALAPARSAAGPGEVRPGQRSEVRMIHEPSHSGIRFLSDGGHVEFHPFSWVSLEAAPGSGERPVHSSSVSELFQRCHVFQELAEDMASCPVAMVTGAGMRNATACTR
ncbi:hypothetical protein SKAU_G00366030 [Synaphobranchus kaupii]|uniref:Uncharacterized protein n=1 Tax=Synaphobranchus kaupii TaxID=118154 RepID=A0A9Q1IFB5_SYNKA|nr:hypothetical protein SKAU_G00366030 [Synaphobranchus kaupii]